MMGNRPSARRTMCVYILVDVVLVFLSLPESHCTPAQRPSSVPDFGASKEGGRGQGESHILEGYTATDEIRERILSIKSESEDDDGIGSLQNELLLVTVLNQTNVTKRDSHLTFWVDHALVYMTVTVTSQRREQCVIMNHIGEMPFACVSTWNMKQWKVHRPTVGQWVVQCEGDVIYDVAVQGVSTLGLQVSLFQTDVSTGVAQRVQYSPTAGRQIRTIIDLFGADLMQSMYNITLVTSDGLKLASDWLRHTGGPDDPQYEATFTWPTQAVYIRVFGEDTHGCVFERQTSYLISPILIDLQLQHGQSSEMMSPGKSLVVRYRLTNHGPSDTFHMAAYVEESEVFTTVVSPSQIRLGQQGSFVGSVTVRVPLNSAASTGLMVVRACSLTKPSVVQTDSILLASTGGKVDLNPPYCDTLSITGNCSRSNVTSSTCGLRHWVVTASVGDDESGLQDVTFADVTSDDVYRVPPFTPGRARDPLVVVFVAPCCKDHVSLDLSDTAGNERRCQYFRAEIQPSRLSQRNTSTTNSTITTTTASTPPGVDKSTAMVLSKTDKTLSRVTRQPAEVNATRTLSTAGTPDRASALTTERATALGTVTLSSNATIALFQSVAPASGGKKSKADYSTLTTASIILGSIGGVAGLCIVLICVIFFVRHRRLLRQRRLSRDSGDSASSSDYSNNTNNSNITSVQRNHYIRHNQNNHQRNHHHNRYNNQHNNHSNYNNNNHSHHHHHHRHHNNNTNNHHIPHNQNNNNHSNNNNNNNNNSNNDGHRQNVPDLLPATRPRRESSTAL